MPHKIDLKFNETKSVDNKIESNHYESDDDDNNSAKNMIVQKGGELPPSAIAGIVIVSIIVLIVMIIIILRNKAPPVMVSNFLRTMIKDIKLTLRQNFFDSDNEEFKTYLDDVGKKIDADDEDIQESHEKAKYKLLSLFKKKNKMTGGGKGDKDDCDESNLNKEEKNMYKDPAADIILKHLSEESDMRMWPKAYIADWFKSYLDIPKGKGIRPQLLQSIPELYDLKNLKIVSREIIAMDIMRFTSFDIILELLFKEIEKESHYQVAPNWKRMCCVSKSKYLNDPKEFELTVLKSICDRWPKRIYRSLDKPDKKGAKGKSQKGGGFTELTNVGKIYKKHIDFFCEPTDRNEADRKIEIIKWTTIDPKKNPPKGWTKFDFCKGPFDDCRDKIKEKMFCDAIKIGEVLKEINPENSIRKVFGVPEDEERPNFCKYVVFTKPITAAWTMYSKRLQPKAKSTYATLNSVHENICKNILPSVLNDFGKKLLEEVGNKLIEGICKNVSKTNYKKAKKCCKKAQEKIDNKKKIEAGEVEKDRVEQFLDSLQGIEKEIFEIVYNNFSGKDDKEPNFEEAKTEIEKLLKEKEKEEQEEIERLKRCSGKKKKHKNQRSLPKEIPGQQGGAVIGRGGFGCVFRPALQCKSGIETKQKDYISKLLVDRSWRINREIKVGAMVRTIENYEDFFAPVLSDCDIKVHKIKQDGMSKCSKMMKLAAEKDKYKQRLVKLKYIDGGDMIANFNKESTFNSLCLFFANYPKLLDSLKLLQSKKIVHYDIKENNIIIDKKTKNPIIIDFGLSIHLSHIKDLGRAFYIEWAPEWTLWPIEVHYLGFVINKKRLMTEEELLELAYKYVEYHNVFKKDLKKQISNSDIKKYRNECIGMLRTYTNMGLSKSIKYIIQNYWYTWDNYSLSVMYLIQFFVLNMEGFEVNQFNKKFIDLLFTNIHPNPSVRLSLMETKQRFKNIILLLSPSHIYLISKQIKKNKPKIIKTLRVLEKKTMLIGNKLRMK